MAAALTYNIHKTIQAGEIEVNLKGAGIGNSWVSGTDIMVSWPPILYHMGVIDNIQYKHMNQVAWDAW